MAREHLVATLAQVPPGCMKRVEVGEEAVVLYNVEGELFASPDVCPHKGAPLSSGDLDGRIVMCPLHAWEFDVRSGECFSFPDWTPLRRYDVRVEGEAVYVTL